MRKNMFQRGNTMDMNLQFFAESGDGAGTGKGEGGGSGSGAGSDPGTGAGAGTGTGTEGNPPPTFDEVLEGEGYQAEFDRRLQKAVNTAVTNAQEKWQALTDDKLSEAEKLARMTKEEKAQYMQQKQERELSERESAITRRELMAEAKNTLAEKKLPSELAEVLNYSNADSCNKSIEAVEKAFQKAVEAGVQERLKGGTPPKKAPGDTVTPEVYAKMGYTERYNLKQSQPDLYKELSGTI